MPRNEKVLPSRRPRIFPHSSWSTGGFRLGPVAGAAAGVEDAEAFGFSWAKALPATPATAPPTRAVVVLSIFRRFIRPNGVFDDSSLIAPLILGLTSSRSA